MVCWFDVITASLHSCELSDSWLKRPESAFQDCKIFSFHMEDVLGKRPEDMSFLQQVCNTNKVLQFIPVESSVPSRDVLCHELMANLERLATPALAAVVVFSEIHPVTVFQPDSSRHGRREQNCS